MEHTNLFLYETEADFLAEHPQGKMDQPIPGIAYVRGEEGELGTIHTNKEITVYTITIHSQNKTGETVAADKTMQTNPVLDGNTVKINIVADSVEGYKPKYEAEKIEVSADTEHTITYLKQTAYIVTVNHMCSGESIAEPTEILIDNVYEEDVVNVLIEPLSIPGYSAEPVTISVSGNTTYNLEYEKHDYSKDYLTLTFFESGTLVLTAGGGTKLFVEYNINDNGWETAELHEYEEITVSVNDGDIIKFRGDNNSYCGWETDPETGERYAVENPFFGSDALFSVEGNIMSLISSNDYEHINSLSEEYNNGAFLGIFGYNNKLISAENLILPAITLASKCYYSMFQVCSSLTTAPELPATTLAEGCYGGMFYGCTSLTTAPALPATTLADGCYSSMFAGCTSLTTAPSILPATTLVEGCYNNMFNGCTSLTTAPELPATTLANSCYSNMFYGCTSLTSAPSILPATTLVEGCYNNMFNGCTSLTTAPELPATTLADYCYSYMFYGCTSLNYIKCLATDISAEGCTDSWVDGGVASTGTFIGVENNPAGWYWGNDGVPNGWNANFTPMGEIQVEPGQG